MTIDWTRCFGYETLVAEEIEHYSTIEVTEELKEGGVAANRAWERWYRFLADLWQTDFVSEIVESTQGIKAPRLLSLGCGHGGMELDCARRLEGREYVILALDLNPGIFLRAREEVARDGLQVRFQAVDLNFVELEEGAFDVVFAHASLHHVLNLEHLFAQVHRALRPQGRLVVLDIIGKSQVLYWPENVRFAAELVGKMPGQYRRGLVADPAVLFPSYLDGASLPGMEGIRQEAIEDQLAVWFRPIKSFKYNSFIRLICTHSILAYRFDVERLEDREYLDDLFRRDLEMIASGELRPSEMFAVYEKVDVDSDLGAPVANGTLRGPKVSALVVAGGSSEDLLATLRSVGAQTYRNVEVLVLVDDRLDRRRLLERLEIEHPTTRLVGCAGDPGEIDLTPALRAATGEYIALLTSPDAWFPVKLSEQVAILEHRPDLGWVHSDAVSVDRRGRGSSSDRRDARPVRSTVLLRSTVCRQLWSASGSLTEADLLHRVGSRWETFRVPRPLGMLRITQPSVEDDPLGIPAVSSRPRSLRSRISAVLSRLRRAR